MNYSLLYNLVFAGVIQGVFLSLFIFSYKKSRTRASIYLGLLILVTSLGSLQYALDEFNLITWHQFNVVYLPYVFLISPMLYFFVITFLWSEIKIKKIEFLLYIPFISFLLITLLYKGIALTSGKTVDNDIRQEQLTFFIDVYGDFINISTILITIIYLFITVRNQRKVINTTKTKHVVQDLLWINIFLSLILITITSWFILNYQHWKKNQDVDYMPVLIIASFVIYASGYIGIYKLNILNQRRKIRSFLKENSVNSIVEKQKNEHILNLEKIVIQDQVYLNPNLTLDFLSEELQLSKSHLSRIINTELDSSFTDYINSLRVSEAKKLLLNSQFSNYTLVAIGLESGFNSKTTFNTAFKKHTGQTPSQFKKNHTN